MAQMKQDNQEQRQRKWYAVTGYNNRVEVLDGEAYRTNPPNMQSDKNPDGWVWIHAIDHQDAPNEATAVYQAVMRSFPSEAIHKLLFDYMEKKDWQVDKGEAEDLEALDHFQVKCGQPSVFEGTEKKETDYGDIVWESLV